MAWTAESPMVSCTSFFPLTASYRKGPLWLVKTNPVFPINEHSFQKPGMPDPRADLSVYVLFSSAFSTV